MNLYNCPIWKVLMFGYNITYNVCTTCIYFLNFLFFQIYVQFWFWFSLLSNSCSIFYYFFFQRHVQFFFLSNSCSIFSSFKLMFNFYFYSDKFIFNIYLFQIHVQFLPKKEKKSDYFLNRQNWFISICEK